MTRYLALLIFSAIVMAGCANQRWRQDTVASSVEKQSKRYQDKHKIQLKYLRKVENEARQITRIHAGYFCSQLLDIDGCRQVMVDVISGLLHKINSDARTRSALAQYPFTDDNLDVVIKIDHFFGEYMHGNYVGRIVMNQGLIYYYAFDGTLTARETYQVAEETIRHRRVREYRLADAHLSPDKRKWIADQSPSTRVEQIAEQTWEGDAAALVGEGRADDASQPIDSAVEAKPQELQEVEVKPEARLQKDPKEPPLLLSEGLSLDSSGGSRGAAYSGAQARSWQQPELADTSYDVVDEIIAEILAGEVMDADEQSVAYDALEQAAEVAEDSDDVISSAKAILMQADEQEVYPIPSEDAPVVLEDDAETVVDRAMRVIADAPSTVDSYDDEIEVELESLLDTVVDDYVAGDLEEVEIEPWLEETPEIEDAMRAAELWAESEESWTPLVVEEEPMEQATDTVLEVVEDEQEPPSLEPETPELVDADDDPMFETAAPAHSSTVQELAGELPAGREA